MTDSHAQLEAWLVDGATGDPPRETAVHATLCESCTARLGAFDALALIDVAAAGSPPPLAAPTRLRIGVAWARLGTAVVSTVVAGVLVVFGASQLLGLVTPRGGPDATHPVALVTSSEGREPAHSQDLSSPEPDRAGTAIPGASATPQPGVTPGPFPPRPPGATPRPPTPRPSATAAPTPAPTPGPTATPAPTPVPECSDGTDNDLDGYVDFGGDPGCSLPSDDEAPVDFHECNDLIDNDSDGYTDSADPGCDFPFGDSELPVDVYQCNDGIDNDGDTFIDWPNDLECTGPFDNDEGVL